MKATAGDSVFVETPTDYPDDVECDHPIELYIGGVSEKAATTISQQLSLFVETHDTRALLRLLDALEMGIDDIDEVAVEVGTPADVPGECYWPVELEVEDIGFDAAHEIVETFTELAADGFSDSTKAKEFLGAVEDATSEQPRSVVRLVKDDGSRRDALEWHTDTDVELESA